MEHSLQDGGAYLGGDWVRISHLLLFRVLAEDLGQFLSQSNSSLFLAQKAPNKGGNFKYGLFLALKATN